MLKLSDPITNLKQTYNDLDQFKKLINIPCYKYFDKYNILITLKD